ncbi:PAS domain-containing protein [Mucilaginibacter terrenus]|uniref:histidine kinase n=1 Tax=Mucilaginibacter terrenus TaxID=2482727 RepID=A0A3E2NQU5_9SPHI|nr:ATP-binding protein [Mucilaginibacter terrenus]RFZ83368.1 PAS domain-containing protein [Mucilaginibacter terrenus]
MNNTFQKNIIAENEKQRLIALRRYRIFNTEAEQSFTSTARLLADIFSVSIAMITFVDDEEVSFQAQVGLTSTIAPRGESFCSLTVLTDEVTVVENAIEDAVVAQNPLVCGDFGLRFYAGAPLITYDGYRIGTLCIVDTKPRTFSAHERSILQGIARIVMEQIELRLKNLDEADKQDVTNEQLQQSNNQLIASEKHFQHILDTMAEGVGIIDLSGRLVYANAMAQKILGLTQHEIKQRTYYDASWKNLRIDGTELPDSEHPMSIMMQTQKPVFDYEIAVQPDKGERFYISINAAPIVDPETNELTGGVGTFMDVTNRRRVLQQKDEFINVASHELKTPVTSLKAAMQIIERLKEKPNPAMFDKMIAQANKSLEKLATLLNDLLNSNRISQGHLQLRKTKFLVSQLVDDSFSHIRSDDKHEIIYKGDLDIEVYADEQQIDQVLVNLVNNAVKYAPDSPNIVIAAERLQDAVRISVKDTGPGIPPEHLPHIFDRYYRSDHSSYQFSGLGLGLYICAEIIKKHNGEIGVESTFGEGTEFWFTLPTKD